MFIFVETCSSSKVKRIGIHSSDSVSSKSLSLSSFLGCDCCFHLKNEDTEAQKGEPPISSSSSVTEISVTKTKFASVLFLLYHIRPAEGR